MGCCDKTSSENDFIAYTRYDDATFKYTAVIPKVDNKIMSPRLPPSVTGSIQKLIDEANIIMAHGMAQLIYHIVINN